MIKYVSFIFGICGVISILLFLFGGDIILFTNNQWIPISIICFVCILIIEKLWRTKNKVDNPTEADPPESGF